MKKIISLILLLAVSVNTFAAGQDASTFEILTFILIIWGILEIVLFFKIWAMTNDVYKIQQQLKETYPTNSPALADRIRKDIICGDKEHAKKLLLVNFNETITNKYYKKFNQDPKGSIEEYVNSLQNQFNKIGEELPPFISNMKTYSDFFDLFSIDDL